VQYSRQLESSADLDRWAPTFLAGQFGEALLMGFAGPGASQDNAMVMEQIRNFISREAEQRAFFQIAYDNALEIIRQHEQAVRVVSEALLERDRLSGEETAALVASTQGRIR
jgi:ATP-dependent Zn protease